MAQVSARVQVNNFVDLPKDRTQELGQYGGGCGITVK